MAARVEFLLLFLCCLPLLHVVSTISEGADPGSAHEGVSSATAEERQASPDYDHLSVLIVTTPLLGHFIPSAILAEALMIRGHNVTIASLDISGLSMPIDIAAKKGIPLLLKKIPKDEFTYDKLEAFADGNTDIFTRLQNLMKFKNMIDGQFLDYFKTLNLTEFDVIVIEDILVGYFCIGRENAAKMVALSVHLLRNVQLDPPWPHPLRYFDLPANMKFHHRLLSTAASKLIEGVMKVMFLGFAAFTDQGRCWSEYQYSEAAGHHLPLIVTSAVGLELARTRTPLIEYVGPLISPRQDPLPRELESWLERQGAGSVVYITMGTVFSMTPTAAKAFVEGIPKKYSVLWSLKNKEKHDLQVDESRFMIMSWVPQTAVLNHSSIGAAILHGGAGGVHQALYFGLPLIVTPLGLDQAGTAARVKDSGAGISLNSDQLTPEVVGASVEALMSGDYAREAKRVGRLLREAGGVDRACDLIELYADIGYDHLVPAYAKYGWSWITYSNVDVYCVLAVCLCVISYIIVKVCGCCCYRCCCNRSKKQKKD